MFSTTGNSTLNGTWNIYTSGITRVNSALGLCATAVTANPAELKLIAQYRGEGHFLRAYFLYYVVGEVLDQFHFKKHCMSLLTLDHS